MLLRRRNGDLRLNIGSRFRLTSNVEKREGLDRAPVLVTKKSALRLSGVCVRTAFGLELATHVLSA